MKVDIFVTESEMDALKEYLEYKHETLKNDYGMIDHDVYVYNTDAKKETELYKKAAIMISDPAFTDIIAAYKELLKAKDELKKAQNKADFVNQDFVNAMANVNIVEDEDDEH